MILRGKYLIDRTGRAIQGAEIAIEGERIAAIRNKNTDSTVPEQDVLDLGCAALLPGLVNAHTHLELSSTQSQVEPRRRFTDWVREIVHATSEWTEGAFNSSLHLGIKQSIESGTTSLGDITREAGDIQGYIKSNMRVRVFHEVIDFNPRTAGQTLESLKIRTNSFAPTEKVLIGLAPHTPFTVSESLLKQCISLAHENDWCLCTHLAETMAETEFLHKGTGEIREFREEFGLPRDWKPPRTSPVRYLDSLGFFERPATLIHCNYVQEEDLDIIARSKSNVVFCPRSHRYFGHQHHPFLKMLDRGINVALGTDSLASSPTLSVLDEMKFLRAEYHQVNPAVILQMATLNGLRALGFPNNTGELEQGCYADIVGVALPEEGSSQFEDPLESLFSKQSEPVFSMVGGKILLNTAQ